MELLIPVASGLESVVKRQLFSLGYEKTPAENGRISLNGDFSDVARLNTFLRSGERVLIKVAKFPARTFDELFDGVYAVNWKEYLSKDSAIFMDGKSYLSALGAIKACGGVAKKAIIRRLADDYKNPSSTFSESGARTIVGVSLYKDEATITLDTSGDGLHKRGYRSLAYDAPLKETLASAILDTTFYNPARDKEKPLADFFCGSGTIPIEGAMKARNIAPGLNRDFDFTKWKCVENGVLARAREEAADKIDRTGKLCIYGSDISPRAIEIAKYHAERAGVGKTSCLKLKTLKTPFPNENTAFSFPTRRTANGS